MQRISLGLVDDQDAVRIGFAAGVARDRNTPVIFPMMTAPTVAELNRLCPNLDVVALDLSLDDGSTPAGNVRTLLSTGARVVLYSVGDDMKAIREALGAGALGIVRKSSPFEETMADVRAAAYDAMLDSADVAAAIDTDTAFTGTFLTAGERTVLGLRAAGLTHRHVSSRTGIPVPAIVSGIAEIRAKYVRAQGGDL